MSGFVLSTTWLSASSAALSVDELWALAERRLATQAMAGLQEMKTEGSADARQGRLLEALCRLQAQPRTQQTVRDAQALLIELKTNAAASDVVAAMAEFFLARSYEIAADVPTARSTYLGLMERIPESLLGQLALSRIVLLDLAQPRTAAGRLAAYEACDGWDSRFTHLLVQRDYHLLMALTGLRYGADPASIVGHVGKAMDTGLLRPRTQADLLLGGASMADQAGRGELAREWRERFVHENPKDTRAGLVKKILSGEVIL